MSGRRREARRRVRGGGDTVTRELGRGEGEGRARGRSCPRLLSAAEPAGRGRLAAPGAHPGGESGGAAERPGTVGVG